MKCEGCGADTLACELLLAVIAELLQQGCSTHSWLVMLSVY